ncbi:phiSA1p31-related protein [Nonomuraea sp. NPDC026600]|uniref:phiSA1p31-related protein n=1 Tax=Nonomuraea sp. NPDC026600 TaxID=3155363 RepID=UPI0033F853D2
MTYLPGETLQITITGQVARIVDGSPWSEIRLDVADQSGGITLPIPLGWAAAKVIRIKPAAGVPKPGELWQNCQGAELFVTKDRYGNPQFATADGRTHSIEWMNNTFGPLTPIRQLPEREREPDWTWDENDDNPGSCTDPSGQVWDLTAQYRDGEGHVWHWAGGFGRDGDDGPIRPLMSRRDWSRTDVQITDIPGPLSQLPADDEDAGPVTS